MLPAAGLSTRHLPAAKAQPKAMFPVVDKPAIQYVVEEAVAGIGAAHPDLLVVSHDPTFVRRADAPVAGKVAIVSGGGSGHEPAHAGYVGEGMLTAAVAGDVFTSPSVDAVLAAIRATAGPAGALLVVKNYTGDVMNFQMAAELSGCSRARSR